LTEPKTYVRPAIDFAGHPTTDRTPRVYGIEEPLHGLIRYGAIMDALTGGRCLVYWDWAPEYYEIGPGRLAFPYKDLMVNLEYRLRLSVNSARADRPFSISIDAGSVIGSANGQPLIAGVKLGVEVGTGLIVSNAALAKATARTG
jgi:hypothetical protein